MTPYCRDFPAVVALVHTLYHVLHLGLFRHAQGFRYVVSSVPTLPVLVAPRRPGTLPDVTQFFGHLKWRHFARRFAGQVHAAIQPIAGGVAAFAVPKIRFCHGHRATHSIHSSVQSPTTEKSPEMRSAVWGSKVMRPPGIACTTTERQARGLAALVLMLHPV